MSRWPALLVAAAVAGGCGGSPSLEEAKRSFVADCANGDDGQQTLCQCVADDLQKNRGFSSAARFSEASEAIRQGRQPPDVVAALQACSQPAPRS